MKRWHLVGAEEMGEGLSVRAQARGFAFQAIVESVVFDRRTNDGMVSLKLLKNKKFTGEKTEAYWLAEREAWGTDKYLLYIADYSHLRELAHNRIKIDRARDARRERFLYSEKGQLIQQLELEIRKHEERIATLKKIVSYLNPSKGEQK